MRHATSAREAYAVLLVLVATETERATDERSTTIEAKEVSPGSNRSICVSTRAVVRSAQAVAVRFASAFRVKCWLRIALVQVDPTRPRSEDNRSAAAWSDEVRELDPRVRATLGSVAGVPC